MSPIRRLAALIFGPPRSLAATPGRAPAPAPFVAAAFLGRPAEACRFAARTVLLGYVDAGGAETARTVTVDEVIRQGGHLYLSAYCHQRFDRRHFRLDRIIAMRRASDGAPLDPAGEAARWTGRG